MVMVLKTFDKSINTPPVKPLASHINMEKYSKTVSELLSQRL